MSTAKEISRQLTQRAEDIARYLLPNGKKESNEWRVGSVYGEEGKSLGVHLSGEKAGIWCDFASGDKGDLLDLWMAVRKISLREAIKEAARHLGINEQRFEAHKPRAHVKPKKDYSLVTSTSPVMTYLVYDRKLSPEIITAFRIGELNQAIIFPYLRDDEPIFIKQLSLKRINGKKQMSVEANCEPCLFGWHLISDSVRSVVICEGEIDCMSLHQYGFSALSVPFGGGAGDKQKWIEYEFDRLAIFDEIYLCFDDDAEGNAAQCELIKRLGRHRCRVVKLPKKDANECLQAGFTKEKIQLCFDESKTLDPEELKRASDFVDDVIELFYPAENTIKGYLPPWQKTKEKILFRPEELSIWTGINGHGKSQFLGHIMLSMMTQGARICIASLELKPKRLLTRLTRQAAGLITPTVDYIHAIHEWYGDKLWLFDLVGTAKFKRLLEVFLYARQRYGIDVFVIDSFMKLDIAEDDYKSQKEFMEQLCDFKNQHNCHINIVVHPRKSQDESQPPGKLDNKGTGAISDLADNCFTVWRNKEKERLLQIKNGGKILTDKEQEKLNSADCFWCCDKQRNGDWEGRFGFWFHQPSLQYLSQANEKPSQFVSYSSLD